MNPNQRDEEAARQFIKDWPNESYHKNDLTTFFEAGCAHVRAELPEIKRNLCNTHEQQVSDLVEVVKRQREALKYFSHSAAVHPIPESIRGLFDQ